MRISPPLSPTLVTSKSNDRISDELLESLSTAAVDEETGARPIHRSIDLLRGAGMLLDDGTKDAEATARALMRVGSVNLSVGRLWEGHVNALLLINLYGTSEVKSAIQEQISNGAFLGVWGADGTVPVTSGAAEVRLMGAKNFASGLGTVSHAIITVNSGPEVQLALVNVSDMKRADPSVWNMRGMKATASGTYDFTGVKSDDVTWIGNPSDYLQEPHFVGGVWRIAALQVGAAVGLLDRAAAQLRAMGRMQAEPQKTRLMSVLMRAWAGMSFVERAALATVRTDLPSEQIVATSISARLMTEEVALDAIRAVEQSIGLQHFGSNSGTGQMAGDLSVYLRQAARDAFLQRAADAALTQDGAIWGVFE